MEAYAQIKKFALRRVVLFGKRPFRDQGWIFVHLGEKNEDFGRKERCEAYFAPVREGLEAAKTLTMVWAIREDEGENAESMGSTE